MSKITKKTVEPILDQFRKIGPEISKLEFLLEQAGGEFANELSLIRRAKTNIGLAGDKVLDKVEEYRI